MHDRFGLQREVLVQPSVYGTDNRCLLAALQPCLGPDAQITGAEQGLHLCLRLPGAIDDKALAAQIAKLDMTVRPLSAYCLQRRDAKGLVIGYGYARLADIERYGPLLARAVTTGLKRLNAILKPS